MPLHRQHQLLIPNAIWRYLGLTESKAMLSRTTSSSFLKNRTLFKHWKPGRQQAILCPSQALASYYRSGSRLYSALVQSCHSKFFKMQDVLSGFVNCNVEVLWMHNGFSLEYVIVKCSVDRNALF